MADQEMIKHTKAAYKAVNNPLTNWKHKLKEVSMEILIIVFAVSLSIWLHSWNEKRHERSEAVAFLKGLNTDIGDDLVQLKSDRETYSRVLNGGAYFLKVSNGDSLNKDSLAKYKWIFYNTTFFQVNGSRYQALKASGKLNIIENKVLLDNIITFYEHEIPYTNMLNSDFNNYKTGKLGEFLDENLVIAKDGSNNWEVILKTSRMRNTLLRVKNVQQNIYQYTVAEKHVVKLQELINEELK